MSGSLKLRNVGLYEEGVGVSLVEDAGDEDPSVILRRSNG